MEEEPDLPSEPKKIKTHQKNDSVEMKAERDLPSYIKVKKFLEQDFKSDSVQMEEEQDLTSEHKKIETHQRNDSVEMKTEQDLPSHIEQKKLLEQDFKSGLEKDLTNTLTHDALLKLFSWLKVEDLISVQRVCRTWRVSAHHVSLWRSYTLTLEEFSKDVKNMKMMPAVRNIDGDASNEILNVILDSVIDLKRLNCIFEPPLSSSQMEKVIEKYPELTSIVFDISAPDVVQSVEMFKTSEHLEEVQFCKTHYNIYFPNSMNDISQCVCQYNALKVLNNLTDLNNFSSLKSLDLSKFTCNKIIEDSSCGDAIADVIKNRSCQLLSLRVDINNKSMNVLDSVNMCTKLKELQISVNGNCPTGVNINKMTELQSLNIRVLEKDNHLFFNKLKDSFIKGSWLCLKELGLILFFQKDINILSAVVHCAKNLKSLLYFDLASKTDDFDLKNISSLLELKYLSINGLKINVEHVISNPQLSEAQNVFIYIANILRPMKNLRNCYLNLNDHIIHLKDKADIDVFIS